MTKPNILLSFFCLLMFKGFAQSGGNFQWILPLSQTTNPIGAPSEQRVAIRENNKVVLISLAGTRKTLPYDSLSYLQGTIWRCWKGTLQGIFDEAKGELVPPVYDQAAPATSDEKNWAFTISRYGMGAVVDDQNKLLLPYQKIRYANFTLIGDTTLGYVKYPSHTNLLYISRKGNTVPDDVARQQMPPDFQRVSSNQYVLTVYKKGVAKRDTFVSAEKFVNGIAIAKKDTLWGYLKQDGSWLLTPRFQAAFPFDAEGLAIVKSKGKYGIVRRDGSFSCSPGFDFLKAFSPGVFEFKEKGQIGLSDASGKVLVSPGPFAGFQPAGADCFAARSGDSLLVFCPETGLLPLGRVMSCSSERYGKNFPVKTMPDAKTRTRVGGVLSPEGKWIIPNILMSDLRESAHHFAVETMVAPCCVIKGISFDANKSGEYLVFDRQGNPVLTEPVTKAFPLEKDKRFMSYWTRENKNGLLGPNNAQLSPEYDEIKPVGNGWFFVKKGLEWGVAKWVD